MGCPKRSFQIRGEIFESQLVADLCKLMGTQKLQTSPYHPQTNGQCERFNSTLIGTLGMLTSEKKSDLKNHIGVLVNAYNCTWNCATGFSPYYLMYGRQPYLPVDVTLRLVPHSEQHLPLPHLYKNYGNMSNEPIRRLNCFRPKNPGITSSIITSIAGQKPWR